MQFTFYGPFVSRENALRAGLCYIRCLRPLRSLNNLKLYRVALLQRAITIPSDRRIVHENIRSVISPDKSVTLRIVEPLHCSLHRGCPPGRDSFVSLCRAAKINSGCAVK